MIPVESTYSPGGVGVITGELTRYAMFQQCLSTLRVPNGSALLWASGPLIAANMNVNFAKFLYEHIGDDVVRDADGALVPTPFQWLWIMGDDHTFSADVLLRLLERQRETGADVIVPGCLNRIPPCAFTIVDESNNRHRDYDKVPHGFFRLKEFEVCGDAGMLLSRRAVEATGPPWYDALISGSKTSEDRWFARKLTNAGFGIHVDTTVTLGHITPCLIEPVWDEVNQCWLVQFALGRQVLAQFKPVPEAEAVPA